MDECRGRHVLRERPRGGQRRRDAPTTTPISIRVNPANTGGAAPALHVSGNQLVTASGATYRLLGVNRASAEFACVQGKGMWDGPRRTRPPSTR